MDRQRPGAPAGAEPVADQLALQEKRRAFTARRLRPRALGQKRPVGDAHGGEAEQGSEMEGQAGPARVVAAGCVYQQKRGKKGEAANCSLEQRPLSQGQQPRFVAGTSRALRLGGGQAPFGRD